MFSRFTHSDAKSLSGSRSKSDTRELSEATSSAASPNSTALPVHIQSRDVPRITTTNGTPLATSSSSVSLGATPVADRPQFFHQNTVVPSSSATLTSPPLLPRIAPAEPVDVSNSSFSVASLDSFGAISVAGSTTAAEHGSHNGSRYGMSPPRSTLVASRGELSSASIRSQRNWDQFEGKPVSPLPSPAVQHEQAQDMFDVPLDSSSRLTRDTSQMTPATRPAAARTTSDESLPSTKEGIIMSSPKTATIHEPGSRNWLFFNSAPSAPIARAPSVKTSGLSRHVEHHAGSDNLDPSTPLSATAPKSAASANSLGHGFGPRVTSADLSSRIRLPSRLPTLPSEAGSVPGPGTTNVRAASAIYSQPQHLGFPRHARISSGESAMSMDAALYSPLSAVDPHHGGDLFNLNSTSQLSLSGISDAPSATLEGLPPNVVWVPDSPHRIRSRSQLLLDDDRSAQSSPQSAVPGRVEQRTWRDAGDVSTDSTTAITLNVAQRASPAPTRSEHYPAAHTPASIPVTNGTEESRNTVQEEPKSLGDRRRRQGPSESATGSSLSPAMSGRDRLAQPAIVESREEEEDGDRIGPYRIEKTLGMGAFSRVALGRLIRTPSGTAGSTFRPDRLISSLPALRQRALQQHRSGSEEAPTHDELVALKMLDREPCNNNERLKVSWVREVEVLKHISHPNLVRFITSFSTPLHHTLVLEQVAGGELFESLMSNFEQFAQREWLVRVIFTELANAIGWMHHINLVHRDIKLENILMTVDLFKAVAATEPLRPHHLPKGPLIKLTDFGLSRFIDPSNPLLETRCGSEEYAAPELIIGKKYDGRKTDAWALGVVLYALITGSLPFMEDVSVGVDGAREGHGENRDSKQRKRHLLRIAKGDLRWPSPANDACADLPDSAVCPTNMRLVTPVAKTMVARLLRRDSTKRATPWETWDEEWLLGGSFGYSTLASMQADNNALPSHQVPNELSAGGERLALHPDPRSQQGQNWLETNAAVRQDDVAQVARDD
ncbi:related to SNF1-related protein kinase KIN10 [Melanopsichium pennsylvanicum]|uniref:Related to SNF1-related protein kinase KIN10 n=2 Tax=Melanopsichium pennsylvanicum TaxID=63383 RepID=A0AAJ4XL89_9BASI|nr:related to SNF1-related protein kinase KIN10 [Melanopsichium pennsylvanicum 4]SNX84864.1 related to SNF1-related protein kinase KIN10 [Melanopsichium pennsylvanicum]